VGAELAGEDARLLLLRFRVGRGACEHRHGTVAELVPGERRARAFGIFYTCTIGAGAIAPALYGLFSDAVGVKTTLVTVALVVLLVLPLTLTLRPALRRLAA